MQERGFPKSEAAVGVQSRPFGRGQDFGNNGAGHDGNEGFPVAHMRHVHGRRIALLHLDGPHVELTLVAVDIQEKLEFKNSKVFQKSFERENLVYAVVFEEGIPIDQPQHAILLASRSGIIVDAWQTEDLSTWELSTRGDPNNPIRIYETHKSVQFRTCFRYGKA